MTRSIRQDAKHHATDVLRSRDGETVRADEKLLVNSFESTTSKLLDDYVGNLPHEPRTTAALVFEEIYTAARSRPAAGAAGDEQHTDEEDDVTNLMAALFACEVEARGPLRLTTAQTTKMAAIAEALARDLLRRGLPRHAALAFTRAADLYQAAELQPDRDRCVLAGVRARHKARAPGLVKARETAADWLCGYGYEPYRLLGWGAVQLALFSALFVLGLGAPAPTGIYVAMMNYLNPIGVGDIASAHMSGAARLPLVVEAYAGLITNSVFFALIVRRWFRL
jgi:hypothetical protein